MEPSRRAVVGSYAAHFTPPENRHMYGAEASAHTSAVIAKVRDEVIVTPFYERRFFERLDLAAILGDDYDIDDLWCSWTQLKFGAR